MKVLLTGVTGQVGRAIALALANRGDDVIGISRRPCAVPGTSKCIEASLGAEDAVCRILEAVEPCESMVHAAASLSHRVDDPSVSVVNCLGTQQLLQLASRWNVRQLVFISGVALIGRPLHLPITEEHPAQPPTAYHASKLYGEHVMRLAENDGRRAVSLRITSPAGPGTPGNRILGVFVRQALAGEPLQLAGRGLRRQNYVDVRDVAAAVDICLRRGTSGFYNIAASESVSNHELATACIEELSSSSAIEFTGRADPQEDIAWEVSISKARSELNFEPRFGIRESIRALAYECRARQ